MDGDADLFEVIGALGPPRRLAGGLNGGEQQRDQHGDDRDDDQQFDQSEGVTMTMTMHSRNPRIKNVRNADQRAAGDQKGRGPRGP